jgi:hypothetical protein
MWGWAQVSKLTLANGSSQAERASKKALFRVAKPSADIYLVLRIEKVLQGDPEDSLDLYGKCDSVPYIYIYFFLSLVWASMPSSAPVFGRATRKQRDTQTAPIVTRTALNCFPPPPHPRYRSRRRTGSAWKHTPRNAASALANTVR